MHINADHAFHIGSQHLRGGMPCQDYAISGCKRDYAYGVISDGCSGGGDTDIGARVIARSTAQALAWSSWVFFMEDKVDTYCKAHDGFAQGALALDHADMLATCGYVATVKGHLSIRLVGDGVIAARSRDGSLVMTKVDWSNNTPVYRAYAADEYAGFIRAHGGRDAMAATVTRQTRRHGETSEKEIAQPLYEMLRGFGDAMSLREFDFVGVFSDGVAQVDGMAWGDVVAELMAFKSTEGDFVKRRMNRFLKDCLKHGKGPIDDISMACIHVDHEAA